MLVVSATSREENRQSLADQFRRARVFTRLRIRQSRFELDSWIRLVHPLEIGEEAL